MRRLLTYLIALSIALAPWQGFRIDDTSFVEWVPQAHATITPSIVKSRAADSVTDTCYAPCGIFFDGKGASATGVTEPFLEFLVIWNFNDLTAGAWSRGRSTTAKKNIAAGVVAAHVYETPGTYRPCALFITTTEARQACTTVIVADPDSLYTTSNTVCLGNVQATAGQGGCPENAATPAGTTDAAAISTNLAQNKRVLLRRGDTFYAAAPVVMNFNGPWTVGAYGTGAAPVIQQNGAGLSSMLQLAADSSNSFKDGRIMDITVRGTDGSEALRGITAKGKFDQLTLLRVTVETVRSGFITVSSDSNVSGIWDQWFIHDSACNVLASGSNGGNCIYIEATQWSVQGNLIDNGGSQEHNMRSMYWDRLVVAHNTLTRPSSGGGKASLSLRAPVWVRGIPTTTPAIPVNTYSQYGVVSDNRITNGGVVGSYIDTGESTITISQASPAVVTYTAPLQDDIWANGEAVKVAVSGAGSLPSPLSAATTYYVGNLNTGTNTFNLCITNDCSGGGDPIATTDAGSGNFIALPTGREGRTRYLVMERNIHDDPITTDMFTSQSHKSAMRNNIVNVGSAGGTCYAFSASGSVWQTVTTAYIENNTCFGDANSGVTNGVSTFGSTSGAVIKNTLVYRAAGINLLLRTSLGSGHSESNNTCGDDAVTSCAGTGTTNPFSATPDASNPASFAVSPGSYAANGGASLLSQRADFSLCKSKTGKNRIGALGYRSDSQCFEAAGQ